MSINTLRLIAKARKKKKQKEEERQKLLNDILSQIPKPKDGKDAPAIDEILKSVIPYLPETKVEQVIQKETIVQQVEQDTLEQFFNAKLPEMDKRFRPKVELIREEVDPEKLKGFVSKKDFDKALQRIQEAISYHSGGGGSTPNVGPLANIIEADQATNIITESQLDISKLNIVHATVSGSTVQLPALSTNYIVWVEDAVEGGGNITITREA